MSTHNKTKKGKITVTLYLFNGKELRFFKKDIREAYNRKIRKKGGKP